MKGFQKQRGNGEEEAQGSMKNCPIGVFDSGIGGISVLRNMRADLPREDFIYFGDDKNAPYGTRPEPEILRLAEADADFLLEKNVKAIVIACNTATSAAAAVLREKLSIPVIGMEPALKPASLFRRDGMIAVLATSATLRQEKFRHLMERYGEYAVPVPCPGLMDYVERGITEGAELDAFLRERLAPFRSYHFEAAVLGCTHYVFLKDAIQRVMPGVRLFDGNEGTSHQLRRVLSERGWLKEEGEGSVQLFSSAQNPAVIRLMQRLLATRP